MRSRWLLLLPVLLCALAVVPAVRWVQQRHAEAAFQRYVLTYITGMTDSRYPGAEKRDRAWAKAHPAAIRAEGHRACDWLEARPSAPHPDRDGVSDRGTLESRYLHHAMTDPLTELHALGTRVVVTAAWAYLCEHVADDRTSMPANLD